ncbi:MAG TPA: CoA-binding protein [Actinomycetota bacterium]|nr:CoA-binding protein [Actinomycetota bacterium]
MANPSMEELKKIYEEAETIAVVGASGDESKAAHTIPRYLKRQGYRIFPVNPKGGEILDEKVYTSLDEIPEKVDVVDVFRPSEETPDVARAAVKAGAKVLWLQQGIFSEEAERIAREGGMEVVMNRCMGETHYQLGLGPGPHGR